MVENKSSALDRTWGRLSRAVRNAAGSAKVRITGQVRPDLPADDLAPLKKQIAACLDGPGGEVSERVRAAELGRTFLALNPKGRRRFFTILAEEFGTNRAAIDAAVQDWQNATDDAGKSKAEARLRQALLPPRRDLFTKFNALPEGIKFLVDLREELLGLLRRVPSLRAVDADLVDLLAQWFDIGFLDLERITWQSPAALLEKLISYEAVHEIRSWSDLKNRLDSDRRCYAFFHPRMPEEPLIFVEVALVEGMAGSVQALLDEQAPAGNLKDADSAIFYSISNCQRGLAGVSFGNFLIKRVVERLQRDLPSIKLFATLSPIPGFREWLDAKLAADADDLLLPDEMAALARGPADFHAGNRVLKRLLDRPGWAKDPAVAEDLRQPLTRLCARYLCQEKRGRQALDRVGHFHLSNGARVERINWLGDTSDAGFERSYGLMVNYRYKLDEIDDNHEAYHGNGTVKTAGAVKKLLR